MNENRRNVLMIGVNSQEFGRVAPFLARDSFEVDRFPSAVGSFELTNEVRFEVLIARFPLPDMELYDFLQGVRSKQSPNMRSSVVLLATSEKLREANSFIGRGANRVMSLEEADGKIQEMISGLLHVAPRKALRHMIAMDIQLGDDTQMHKCQTENMSATGMLLKIDKRYEIGTELKFEFTFEDDHRPIVGIAEIVRHTMVGRDKVGGIGVRFLSFAGDSQRRYMSFIEKAPSLDDTSS